MMRTLVAMVLAFSLTTVSISQAEQLTDQQVEIAWEKLRTVTSGADPTEAVSHLTSHGMSKEAASSLVGYTEKAYQRFIQEAGTYEERVCSRADQFRTGGQQALARFIEENTARQTAYRRRGLEELKGMLSAKDNEQLNHLLYHSNHGPKVHIVDAFPSTASFVRSGELSVESVLTTVGCNKAEGKNNAK